MGDVDTPTASQLRQHSPYLKAQYLEGDGDTELELLASITAPLVGSLTGRAIAGNEGEEVPAALLPLAFRAIAMKTEQFDAALGSRKSRRRSMNRGNLASFSAGSYSESYFGPDQAMKAKRLDPDPILAELLWALCTDAKKQEWLELWDPEAYPSGEGGLRSFEYGNRPNYGPVGGPGYGWWG